MKRHFLGASVSALVVALTLGLPSAQAAEANLDCKLKFSLTGWSLVYKRAEGGGIVTCENGKSMPVKITANGGGLTVGKTHIDNGTGKFTDVHRIEDVLGTYAQGDASIARRQGWHGAGIDQRYRFARARGRGRGHRHRRQFRRLYRSNARSNS